MTRSTPAWRPMALAVRSLSPVSITTSIPIFCSSFTACGLSSLITSATAIIPASIPFFKNIRGVFPSSASFSAWLFIFSDISVWLCANFRLPPFTSASPTFPSRPFPGSALNSLTGICSACFSAPYATIAFANGCSLLLSSEYANFNSSSSEVPSAASTSVTFGSPLVMVPVLSNATISTFPVSSRETAVLKRIPFFAPIPFPTMIATGVASPKAQGQLITRTEIPLARAKPTLSPAISHTITVSTAMEITAGTKIPETLSATFAMGALVAAASLTIRMIWESVVSSPTRVASQRIKPDWLMVAAETRSPACLSTGILSPVRAASFTALFPSNTTPSTGIFSPGRTTNTSPMRTCSTGTSVSFPSFSTTAVFGDSFIRLFKASVVFPLERASNIFPTVISVRIMAADSK